jgi:hypothetical protein
MILCRAKRVDDNFSESQANHIESLLFVGK